MEVNVLIDASVAECFEAGWLQQIAEQVLVAEGAKPETELGLVVTDQEKMQQLNRNYRQKDEPTDVLAFSTLPAQGEDKANLIPFVMPPDSVFHLGEVIISYPQAVMQAEEHHHSTKKEVAILIIHGVLHLLGYEHNTTEREQLMKTKEAAILRYIERGQN